MEQFFVALTSVLLHPVSIIAIVLLIGLWTATIRRVLHLDRAARELRSLPPAKRRYTLERTHNIYPGKDRPPLGHVRKLRQRYLTAAAAVTCLALFLALGITAQQVAAASSIHWTLDDSRIRPRRYGYLWHIEINNESTEPLTVSGLELRVLDRTRHDVTGVRRPDFGPAPQDDSIVAMLEPDLEVLSLREEVGSFTVQPGQLKILRLNMAANHEPSEGWIYEAQLDLSWSCPRLYGSRSRLGKVYRLGWPGLVFGAGEQAGDVLRASPVADDPELVPRQPD